MPTSKTKVCKPTQCNDGEHQFIVSNWVISHDRQKANGYTCQRCLYSVDGKMDIDTLRDKVHAEVKLETKADKPLSKDNGSKGDKNPSGKGKDS